MKLFPTRLEAAIGGKLLQFASRKMLEHAGLVKKELKLQDGLLTMHYYERRPEGGGINNKDGDDVNAPTLLICHGITDQAKNVASLVGLLKKDLPQWRILVPDLIGHGHDLERVHQQGIDEFEYPHPETLLQSMQDFLTALKITKCHALGISLGGALVYYLQDKMPDTICKAILISPALESVVEEAFLQDFFQGRKNHFCMESRHDLKILFRDMSCPHRHKKDPVPKFLLEAIWQERLRHEPPGHFRKLFLNLLERRGKDPSYWSASQDVAPQLSRLVIWPQEDIIANHDKGQAFFADSPQTIFHSIPDCGHAFHANGQHIYNISAPLITDYCLKTTTPFHEKHQNETTASRTTTSTTSSTTFWL